MRILKNKNRDQIHILIRGNFDGASDGVMADVVAEEVLQAMVNVKSKVEESVEFNEMRIKIKHKIDDY